MRVLHCCLSCFYIDGYTYQENMLVREHVSAGNDVLVIASTESFNEVRAIDYVAPGEYLGSDGANVIRLPYRTWLPHIFMSKLRMHRGVYNLIEGFGPDVIVFHGACGWELVTVAKYVRRNPKVKLFVDSHEDSNNSARSWLSKKLLYNCFYVPIIRSVRGLVEKFLYITFETKLFCLSVYGLKDTELEFFPLGGVVIKDEQYVEKRSMIRLKLDINRDEIMFFQSGKFDDKKKLIESLRAFHQLASPNAKFVIAGSIDESIKVDAEKLISQDSRIKFVGWVNSEQLIDLLCAADVYVQPGSQSATLQMSIAARCAVIIDDVPSHFDILNNNGFLVRDEKGLVDAMRVCIENNDVLIEMSRNSLEFACKSLDYAVLAARLLK